MRVPGIPGHLLFHRPPPTRRARATGDVHMLRSGSGEPVAHAVGGARAVGKRTTNRQEHDKKEGRRLPGALAATFQCQATKAQTPRKQRVSIPHRPGASVTTDDAVWQRPSEPFLRTSFIWGSGSDGGPCPPENELNSWGYRFQGTFWPGPQRRAGARQRALFTISWHQLRGNRA